MKVFLGMSEEKFGEVMKKLRTEHNYTQKKVADYLGIDRTTYTKYETVRKPEIDVIMKLAVLYDISIDEFFGDFFEVKDDARSHLKRASEPEKLKEITDLTDEEKMLVAFYRESVRKKEILDNVREIWCCDTGIEYK